MEWSLYSRSRWAEPWRYQFLTIGLGLWLGALCIAGLAYVLSSEPSEPPNTLAIAKAASVFQPTRSPPPSPSQRADKAWVGAEEASSSVYPDIVANDHAAPTAITAPANPVTKSAPSVPAVAEDSTYRVDDPAARVAAIDTALLATSAFAEAQPAPDTPAPEAQLSDAERALFTERGNALLAAGDIASARLYFERAADAGDARSALGMAKTFDPVELARAGVRGLKSDQAKADYWYQRAHVLAGDQNFDRPEGQPP